MIILNVLYVKLLLRALYAKKEKDVIYASKLKSTVEIVLNNAFVILVIFENDAVNVQSNSIVQIY